MLVARCREFVLKAVPSSYRDFENLIEQLVATCVYSRTNEAHREKGLVRGNASLLAVWKLLVHGQPVRIVPMPDHLTAGRPQARGDARATS